MTMQQLNLPAFSFSIQKQGQRNRIFDRFRRRWVNLSPEEWVRQNLLVYLVECLAYPPGRLSLEHSLSLGNKSYRADALVFDRMGQAFLLIECKAPSVPITQKTLDQACAYNLSLKLNGLLISNGLDHRMFIFDTESGIWKASPTILPYEQLIP